jgi:foldase protein PrsA
VPVRPLSKLPVLLVLAALAAAGCSAPKQRGPAGEQAAEVNGHRITVAQVDELAASGKQTPGSAPSAADQAKLATQALNSLIQEQIVVDGAAADGIRVTDQDVDARLAELKQQVTAQGGTFEQALASQHVTEAMLRAQLRVQLLAEREAARLVPGRSDADLRPELERRSGEFVEVRARHVLVKNLATAEKVRAALVAGGDWTAVAKQYGTDATKDKGGDLGYNPRGRMVPQFDKTMFRLAAQGDCKGRTNGDCTSPISQVVKTQFGFHVVQVTGVRLPALDNQVKAKLEPDLYQRQSKAVEAWYTGLASKATVTVDQRYGRWDAAAGKVVNEATTPTTGTGGQPKPPATS